MLVTTEANFVYLTGFAFDPLWASPTRVIAALVAADSSLQLLLPAFLEQEARELLPDAHVYSYEAPPQDPIPLLAEITGRGGQPIGVEFGGESRLGMTPANWRALTEYGRADRFVDGQELLWGLRTRKSPGEIEWLRAAAHANAMAFRELFAERRLGLSERQAAHLLFREGLAGGADRTGWVAVTSGPGSYHRFVSGPRDRRIQRGDMLWADLGLLAGGYWTDYCRAGVVGGPSTRQQDLQDRILDCTQAGVDAVASGVPVSDIARACRERAEHLRIPMLGFGRLGHGIGLSATEPPSIAEWDATVLEPGMVITIEPAVVDETGLYCVEQVLAVTDLGSDVLSSAPGSLASI